MVWLPSVGIMRRTPIGKRSHKIKVRESALWHPFCHVLTDPGSNLCLNCDRNLFCLCLCLVFSSFHFGCYLMIRLGARAWCAHLRASVGLGYQKKACVLDTKGSILCGWKCEQNVRGVCVCVCVCVLCTGEKSFWSQFGTPLYKKGIKQIKNCTIETTKISCKYIEILKLFIFTLIKWN